MPTTSLYGIANCDTVKRARAWFDASGIDYRFVDFKKAGLEPARLARWVDALGWEALLNRRGTTWRQIDVASQATVVDAASAAALMRAQPSVIKRPVVEWPDGSVTVGFDAERWAAYRG
jgi:Spx/MgsR family transcriptional regulator